MTDGHRSKPRQGADQIGSDQNGHHFCHKSLLQKRIEGNRRDVNIKPVSYCFASTHLREKDSVPGARFVESETFIWYDNGVTAHLKVFITVIVWKEFYFRRILYGLCKIDDDVRQASWENGYLCFTAVKKTAGWHGGTRCCSESLI